MYGVEGFRRVRWTQSLKNVSIQEVPGPDRSVARQRDSETQELAGTSARLHVCRDAKTGSMVGFVLARGCAKLYGVTSLSLVVRPLIRWELRRTLDLAARPPGTGPRNPWGRFGACCSRDAGEMPLTLMPETSGILLMPSQSIRHISEYSMAWMSPY
jgi:hypothetical protein